MNRSYGLENEKAIVDSVGNPDTLNTAVFSSIFHEYDQRGLIPTFQRAGDTVIGVHTPIGIEGIDGSFNIGESSTTPVSDAEGGLNKLDEIVNTQLAILQSSLESQGKGILNMSNSPLVESGATVTRAMSLPKPGSYARENRMWQHEATLHGQVQNSPSTSVSPEEAAAAINAIIGFSPAVIGIYANSPFHDQKVTRDKEHRLRLWDSYFAKSAVGSDRELMIPPSKPFDSTKEYFDWMFGDNTSMFCIYRNIRLGDVAQRAVLIPETPMSVHEYLRANKNRMYSYPDQEAIETAPTLADIAANQFMQFASVRLRYQFKDPEESAKAYIEALHGGDQQFDAFLSEATSALYIENRDSGANFADEQVAAESPDAARSIVVSESAIQSGLLRNLNSASQLIKKYQWSTLMGLREAAVTDGLEGEYDGCTVYELAKYMLEIAESGLHEDEKWMLEYPKYVLQTRRSGADRALMSYERSSALTEKDRIRDVCKGRIAIQHSLL